MNDLRAKSPDRPRRGQPQQPGELLTIHLHNTLEALIEIRRRVGNIPSLPAEFWTWAAVAALLHDTGKLPHGFQRMIGNTTEPQQVWGERHEVLSLGFVNLLLDNLPAHQRLWIATAVAGHHRAFTGINVRKPPVFTLYCDDNPETFAARFLPADEEAFHQLCDWLHHTATRFDLVIGHCDDDVDLDELTSRAHTQLSELVTRWEWSLDFDDDDGVIAVLLLGAVTMADHISSAHTSLDTRIPLPIDYRTELVERLALSGDSLRPQQEQAEVTTGHMLLRSWTASGKTEASLLWARTQITDLSQSHDCIPRIFYILPYLASINAMTDRLAGELRTNTGIGVAHSKSGSYHLARSLTDGCPSDDDNIGDAADKAHSRAQATRNFRELLRVGTPYQLLKGALAGPVHSSILTESANSVFIFDELHAFDAHRLGWILAMMRFWERIGGRIAVLSATLPTALTELVTTTLSQPVSLVKPPPEADTPRRHRIHLRETHLTSTESIEEIREQLASENSVLVVANNVKDAIFLYSELKSTCVEHHGEGSSFLLHSRFKRMHRDTIEKGIQQRFGVGLPRQPGLLIGTQVVEVSLNIDLALCHTSAADLEALLQRFGRANRIGARPAAPVIVHEPMYTKRRNQGPELWADGVYKEKPTRLAWDILSRYDGQVIDENLTTAWLDEVYASPWGTEWRAAVECHRNEFDQAFLAFAEPFKDRSALSELFDQLFDGTEAILAKDLGAYEEALNNPDIDSRAAGRLLADQYLIPMPYWAGDLTVYEKKLRVRVIDGDYNYADDGTKFGLRSVCGPASDVYRPGEIL